MILQVNVSQKKAGIATFMTDKMDFKPKKVTRQRWAVYNDKVDNSLRRHNSY